MDKITVSLCFYDTNRSFQHIFLQVPVPSSVQVCLEKAAEQFPEYATIFLDTQAEYGIYSAKAAATTMVQAFDRIEFYQPLTFDPMESRRRRAEKDTKERKKFAKRRIPHKQRKKTL